MTYGFLIRLFLGLALGLWLASRFRGALRAVVVRSMPVRYRMSEKYFNIQARISTLLAFLLAFSIAFIAQWGLEKLTARLDIPWFETVSEARVITRSEPASRSLPVRPEPPAPSAEVLPSSPPVAYEATEARPVEPEPAVPAVSHSFFLQLSAFQHAGNAYQDQAYWQARLEGKVHLGTLAADAVPYKILIGPFPSRSAALAFRDAHQLQGFARRLEHIRLE